MRVARVAAATAMLVATAQATATTAAPATATADELTLNVVGACPDADAVRGLLAPLVSAEEGRTAPVSVEDRGQHFRVAVREVATTIDDPGRDCAGRARLAAVLAANELHVRHVVLGPPVLTIEKGAVFDFTSTSQGVVWSPGAEFRGAFGSEPWSLVLSAGARGRRRCRSSTDGKRRCCASHSTRAPA